MAFVNIFNLQYPEISVDPIFPATNSSPCSYSNQTCWEDSFLPASVLGCTELAEVCSPTLDTCYDVWDPNTFNTLSSVDWDGAEETYLTMFGLNYSDFGSTLSTKHGFLLDATRRIVGSRVSQSLDPEQWKLEVRRLFGMSLLRTKFEMLYVVHGTRANELGYINVLPDLYQGVCGKFMFQANGYKNISFIGILAAIFTPLFLGLEYKEKAPIVWLLVCIRKLGHFLWTSGLLMMTALCRLIYRAIDFSRRILRHPRATVPIESGESVTKVANTIRNVEISDRSSTIVVRTTSLPEMSDLKGAVLVSVNEV